MHITLINPPFIFTRKSDIIFSQCLGILYIGTYLQEKRGHQVTIIDALFEGYSHIVPLTANILRVGLSNEEITNRIPESTDLIGISVPFSHLASLVHRLISEIKSKFPSIPLVMGGVYPSTQPELALRSSADYIIRGEGELALSAIIDNLTTQNKQPFPAGVIGKDQLIKQPKVNSTYVPDINVLPPLNRNLLPFEKYITKSPRNRLGWRTASIITSRGCPFACEFCSVHPVCGYKWRPRNAESVVAEINSLVDEFAINHLEIEDDNFTYNHDRACQILDGIIVKNNTRKWDEKISWSAPNGLRIDTLDAKIMQLFVDSNCAGINLALEHGDPEVLKSMNKKLSLSKVTEVVELINKLKIPATVFAIYGYPGETRARFNNAVNFYVKLKRIAPSIEFAFFIAQPYPGTKLFTRCVRAGYIKDDIFNDVDKISRFSTENAYWIKTPEFDELELKWRKKVLMATLTPQSYIRSKIKSILPERLITLSRFIYHMGKRYLKI